MVRRAEKALRHATDEIFSPRIPGELRRQAVHHDDGESRKLIYNLFSCLNLASHIQPTPRSLLNNFSICLMGCQDKGKKSDWWNEPRQEDDGEKSKCNALQVEEKWFNIQNAVCGGKSLINHGNGRQVQEGITIWSLASTIHKFSFCAFDKL